MNIKITKKPTGVPTCSVACSSGVTNDRAPEVTMFIRSYDAHDMGDGVGWMIMSLDEAKDLANQILKAVESAETLVRMP